MPYITDAGASCGANFNGLGAKAGITIVGGHEFAETETDIFPNGGWLDGSGAENGDKCAWISSGQGASANVTMSGGDVPGAVALEQRLQQRRRRLRPVVLGFPRGRISLLGRDATDVPPPFRGPRRAIARSRRMRAARGASGVPPTRFR